MYAGDRQGLLMDVSRVFTEAKIDVKSMNIRTSKKGTATLDMGFIVHGREELNSVIEKLRQIESVMDIERTAGEGAEYENREICAWPYGYKLLYSCK